MTLFANKFSWAIMFFSCIHELPSLNWVSSKLNSVSQNQELFLSAHKLFPLTGEMTTPASMWFIYWEQLVSNYCMPSENLTHWECIDLENKNNIRPYFIHLANEVSVIISTLSSSWSNSIFILAQSGLSRALWRMMVSSLQSANRGSSF